MYDHSISEIKICLNQSGKGEVSFYTWKYEVRCLLEERIYGEEQILQGIRRSCKGDPVNILRRLGTGVSAEDILKKFESTYGHIDSEEMVLKKFYACQQNQDESVTAYTAKLEELFAHAVEIKAVDSWNSRAILKGVFFQGLNQPIKQMSAYKFDTVDDSDRFKVEVCKIESELNLTKQEEASKPKCSAINKAEQRSELSEVKDLLKQMNKTIEKLKQEN